MRNPFRRRAKKVDIYISPEVRYDAIKKKLDPSNLLRIENYFGREVQELVRKRYEKELAEADYPVSVPVVSEDSHPEPVDIRASVHSDYKAPTYVAIRLMRSELDVYKQQQETSNDH